MQKLELLSYHGFLLKVGNKQILTMELDITRSQLEDNRKLNNDDFWCVCQGWSYNGDTIISRKATVKLACKFLIFRR